jgi:hypothetical protein
MARFRAWLVAAVAVVLLGGLVLLSRQPTAELPTSVPSVQGAPVPSPVDTRTSSVTELLKRRADAVLHRNRAAFLADIDPLAGSAFRAAQRSLFDNLAGVPLSSWAYRVDPGQVVIAPTITTAADEQWAPAVELDYALVGVDSAPTAKQLGYLFARRGDTWYLTSDTVPGRQTWRGPWDFGPTVLFKASSGFVLAHPDNTTLAKRIAGELDGDVAAVSEVWGSQWPQRVAVLLPDTIAELKALVGPEFAVDAIAAVAVADKVDHTSHTATGQRVVLNPTNAAKMSAALLRVVLRHEMTHIAARGVTVDGVPMWMLEGFADYVGYRGSGIPMAQVAPDVAWLVRAGTPPDALPSNGDFAAGGDKINLAYQEAGTVNSYIAETYGRSALVRLYLKIAGGDLKAPVDDALRAVLGVDQAGLVQGWQEYLRQQL